MFFAPRLTRNDGIIISTVITFRILERGLSSREQPMTYATLDVALWELLLNEVFEGTGGCDEYRDYKVKPPESRAIIAQTIINLHEPFLSDFVAKWESGDVQTFGPTSSIPLPPNYVRDFAVNERFSVFRD